MLQVFKRAGYLYAPDGFDSLFGISKTKGVYTEPKELYGIITHP